MNVMRGVFSIGVTIGCMLDWINIGIIQVSGINWGPAMFLLFASLLSSGYAFYNSYNNTNLNTWVYLFTGLLGLGVVVFAYVFVKEKVGYLDMVLDTDIQSLLSKYVGIGYYLTGIFSILLFITGFDKSGSNNQLTSEMDSSKTSITRQVRDEEASNEGSPVQQWLKENPGKSLNDYFAKHK